MLSARTIFTGAVALAIVAAWRCMPGETPSTLMADVALVDTDTDGDFVPDVVEWACLSNALVPDTDGDGVADFVEIVQRASPREPGLPRPTDHEMRAVVTLTCNEYGVMETNLHLLFRFMGGTSLLSSFQPWLRTELVPGLVIPLDVLATRVLTIEQRVVPNEGLWIRVRVPLAAESVIQTLLPGTLGASAMIGGRPIVSSVPLTTWSGQIYSLVPYSETTLAFQTIGMVSTQGGASTNRVCVYTLVPVPGGGGTVFLISEAACEDCNDLLCAPGCLARQGELILLPAGVESITGG